MPVTITCANCGAQAVRPPSQLRTKVLFCSQPCRSQFYGRIRIVSPEVFATRFWARVQRGAPEECWEWMGARSTNRRGYGHVGWGSKVFLAHRVALALTDGDWANPLHVCHTCDNPPCCNPAHLWRGTDQDNMDDMVSKGRHNYVKGEEAWAAKLTADDVSYIRTSSERGVDLAQRFGVTKTLIGHIRKYRKWRHLP